MQVGGGTKGYPTADVSNIQVLPGVMNNQLKWTDPEDTMLDNIALAVWKKTVVVRKAGNIPEDTKDGVVIAENSVRNAYQNTWYEDTNNLIAGVTYYYRFFTISTEGVVGDGSPTVKITAADISPILSENSWERIAEVSAAGTASQFWDIGDKIDVDFGTGRGVLEFEIIDFDHDYISGTNDEQKAGITFGVSQAFDTGINALYFDDSVYGQLDAYRLAIVDVGLKNNMKPARKYFGKQWARSSVSSFEFRDNVYIGFPAAYELLGNLTAAAFGSGDNISKINFASKMKQYPIYSTTSVLEEKLQFNQDFDKVVIDVGETAGHNLYAYKVVKVTGGAISLSKGYETVDIFGLMQFYI